MNPPGPSYETNTKKSQTGKSTANCPRMAQSELITRLGIAACGGTEAKTDNYTNPTRSP